MSTDSLIIKESLGDVTPVVLGTLRAFYEVIKESTTSSPLSGVPSGHLYAAVMGQMTFELYTSHINKLKDLGLITEKNNLLSAVPTLKLSGIMHEVPTQGTGCDVEE